MTQQADRPRHVQHAEDGKMLRTRETRLGEPVLTGDRWWPHETWKYADLHHEGARLTGYQAWLAEREMARRADRAKMSSIIHGDSLSFEPTRAPGVYVAYIVSPHLGREAPTHTIEILHIRPGARTIMARENESVAHVLSGHGRSTVYEEQVTWGPHDSIHVPEGAWYQHENDGSEPVNLLIGRVTPLIEQIYTMAVVYKGDSFSDLPDDYQPEHPFTKDRVTVAKDVEGMKWMSQMQLSHHKDTGKYEEENRDSRKLMRAADAVIERSHHKGDWKVALIDSFVGFTNKILGMYVHQLPPNCHTETHKHGWAPIYVLSGRGYSIVDGDRYDWKTGDLINVPAGAWHQHFNTSPDVVSQHLVITNQPLRWRVLVTQGFVEERNETLPEFEDDGYSPSAIWWD